MLALVVVHRCTPGHCTAPISSSSCPLRQRQTGGSSTPPALISLVTRYQKAPTQTRKGSFCRDTELLLGREVSILSPRWGIYLSSNRCKGLLFECIPGLDQANWTCPSGFSQSSWTCLDDVLKMHFWQSRTPLLFLLVADRRCQRQSAASETCASMHHAHPCK